MGRKNLINIKEMLAKVGVENRNEFLYNKFRFCHTLIKTNLYDLFVLDINLHTITNFYSSATFIHPTSL